MKEVTFCHFAMGGSIFLAHFQRSKLASWLIQQLLSSLDQGRTLLQLGETVSIIKHQLGEPVIHLLLLEACLKSLLDIILLSLMRFRSIEQEMRPAFGGTTSCWPHWQANSIINTIGVGFPGHGLYLGSCEASGLPMVVN